MKRTLPCLLIALAITAGAFASCASSSKSNDSAMDGAYSTASYSMTQPEAVKDSATAETVGMTDSGIQVTAASILANQKIIQYLYYTIETLDFDASTQLIESLCSELGGYIQSSSLEGAGINYSRLRYATYQLRLPQEQLVSLQGRISEVGTITAQNTETENVTEQYYDVESRLASLRTQEERLLALLEQSASLSEIIELEAALADVTYQIEQLTGTLRQYDSLINYSTVTIHLEEVTQYTDVVTPPKTLGDRISQAFSDSLSSLQRFGENLLIFIVGYSPILLLFAIIVVTVILIIHRVNKKSRAKQAAAIQAAQAPMVSQPSETENQSDDNSTWKQP